MTSILESIVFPTLVYIGFGPHSRAGGSYNFVEVKDDAELDVKLKSGWYLSLNAAIDAYDNGGAEAPPTRQEMEIKAKDLGIKFTKKTTNGQLMVLIDAAITAPGVPEVPLEGEEVPLEGNESSIDSANLDVGV